MFAVNLNPQGTLQLDILHSHRDPLRDSPLGHSDIGPTPKEIIFCNTDDCNQYTEVVQLERRLLTFWG